MKCDRAMQRLLLLDHGERPDRRTTGHLDRCTRCRTEYERLNRLMAELEPADGPAIASGDLIMATIRDRAKGDGAGRIAGRTPAYYRTWIATAALIVTGLVTLPYNTALAYLYRLPGSGIVATTGIAMGGFATVYLCLFVATHLEELSALLRRDVSPK